MNTPRILHGNNLDLLRTLPDNSIDSIVTDPPYELGFMGKKWDSTGIAYSVELWSECLRVLKSGGHLLAFSGSRTYHRMVVAIEDAGFEIRDQIMWVYGSGFPKSLDISKAIDKAAGAERTVIGEKKQRANSSASNIKMNASAGEVELITAPATDEAQQWSGWGTALKPAHEPIVMARKPIDGTVANNVLKHGVGGINIDGCRVETTDNFDNVVGRPIQKLATRREGETDDEYRSRVLESPAQQEALAKLKELGRFPANFIHDGSEEVLALFPDTKGGTAIRRNSGGNTFGGENKKPAMNDLGYGDDGSAARFFYCAKASKAERNAGLEGMPAEWKAAANFRPNHMEKALEGDSGNPFGRFQPTQNFHPTVKPIALMRYLVRLVTPPNGTVLDPFTGSGTTLVAAVLEGFNSIGMELTADYLPIINARVEWALKQPREPEQPTLF
jgi:site-specific DNA-methyltransferase (adenine-specific)